MDGIKLKYRMEEILFQVIMEIFQLYKHIMGIRLHVEVRH